MKRKSEAVNLFNFGFVRALAAYTHKVWTSMKAQAKVEASSPIRYLAMLI